MKHLFRLAGKLTLRDLKSGEVRVLLLALVIAVASVVAIGSVTDRLSRGMGAESSAFLGADLQLTGPRELPDNWFQQALDRELAVSPVVAFSTVVVAGDAFQLASIKAVGEHYPLRGKLMIADEPFAAGRQTTGAPPAGAVWIEPRLVSLLGTGVGDQLEIGQAVFTIAGIISKGPGGATSVFGVAPGLVMNRADVEATAIIQPGSRVNYQFQFAGPETAITDFSAWLEPQLDPTQRLVGARDGTPTLKTALDRADAYLGLAGLVAVALAGIAIAVSANRYSRRHFDHCAILRCLGATSRQAYLIFGISLMWLGLAAVLIGCLAGWLIQEGLIWSLRDQLPAALPVASVGPYLVGLATGSLVLIGFALPAFLRLGQVTPLKVLRKDLDPPKMSSLVVYGLAISALLLLMRWQGGDWKLVLFSGLGALVAAAVLLLAAFLLFGAGARLSRKLPGATGFAVSQLRRYRAASLGQILAFGGALLIMLNSTLVRTDLLADWQTKLPDKAPNHFLVNLQESRIPDLEAFLEQASLTVSGIYPMVRGRIVEINGETPEVALPGAAENINALRRELNLTWSTELPKANSVEAGHWWPDAPASERAGISVEKRLAERLKISVGDTLTFSIADARLTAEVKSLREVDWDSFQPNFFVIFEPGALAGYPGTAITSFYLAPEQKPLLNDLIKTLPTVTIIELDAIMEEVQRILDQVTQAVEFVLAFVFLASIAVLLATLQASKDERMHTAALLRTLGASSGYLRTSLISEFVLLGLFAGLLASLGTELIAAGLYSQVFDLPVTWHGWVWVAGPLAGMLVISIAGWFGSREVASGSPVRLLRETA